MRAAASRSRRWRRTFIPPSNTLPSASTAACISSATPWAGCWRASMSRGIGQTSRPHGDARHTQWWQRDRRPPEAHRRYRAWFGPAGQQLVTQRDAAVAAMFPPVDYPVGIIRATGRSIRSSAFLPKPHDGRVSVENTKLDGMADHIVMETSHPWLVRNGPAIEQTIVFLRDGEFRSCKLEATCNRSVQRRQD